MKIYTKTGDKGQTSLIGGSRVPKHHVRIEAYGTVDELNSWVGLVSSFKTEAEVDVLLHEVQNQLFNIGSLLASTPDSKMNLPKVSESAIEALEKEIDRMELNLQPLKNFILPGGSTEIAQIHVCRCVCRRAERLVVALSESEVVDELAIKFLNRLSDYLFILGRYHAAKNKVDEILWNPSGR
jgi:cob(I)alamin adenosyltransferase